MRLVQPDVGFCGLVQPVWIGAVVYEAKVLSAPIASLKEVDFMSLTILEQGCQREAGRLGLRIGLGWTKSQR